MSSKEITLPEVTDKKPGKLFIIISYVLALASLIAMLFVPLYDGNMFIKYVLSAVAPILDKFHVSVASINTGFFINELFSLAEGIMLTLIYLSVILALIMLIPVIAGKASKGTNLRCAFAAEYIAFLFLLAYVTYEVLLLDSTLWYDFSLIIPLGVIMLVMGAQSIKSKGGLGVARFIILLLALVTLFSLSDIVSYIPVLEDPLSSLSGTLGAYTADVTFMGSNVSGLAIFAKLCEDYFLISVPTGNIPALVFKIIASEMTLVIIISIFIDTLGILIGNKKHKNGKPNPQTAWFVIAAIRYSLIILMMGAAVALSFFLDGFGKVGIYMYITAALVLLTFIVEIIRFCVGKSKVKAYKKEQERLFKNETIVLRDDTLVEDKPEEVEETTETEDIFEATEVEEAEEVNAAEEVTETQTNIFDDEEIVEVQPVEETQTEEPAESFGQQLSILDAEPVEEEVEGQPVDDLFASDAVVEETFVEEPVAVPQTEDNGFNLFGESQTTEQTDSIDPFIDKLTDEERAQFFDIFINRNKGKFSSIPVYKLNGNNADFFPSVFVHINRMRNICSDSLLAKIYKEIGND
ncbi:MAG: hypothetical protein ACI4QI_05150 [Candidatus Coproplasma sp.]